MTIVRLITCWLFFQLMGCAHVTESFHTRGEADIQEIYATLHKFMKLKTQARLKQCKSLEEGGNAIQKDRLVKVKQAFMIVVQPTCGDLDDAILHLRDAKLGRIDRGFEQFLNYHIALMERLETERVLTLRYQKRLKKAKEKESVLQEKLDEIKSIEKTLNNRED